MNAEETIYQMSAKIEELENKSNQINKTIETLTEILKTVIERVDILQEVSPYKRAVKNLESYSKEELKEGE